MKYKLKVNKSHEPTKDIRCHAHGEVIKVDCSLRGCPLWTKFPNVQNCILVYMDRQELTALKPIDVSVLRRIPVAQVNKKLITAMSVLRGGTLKTSTHTEISPKFTVLLNQNVCYCCESPIVGDPAVTSTTREGHKVVYCSQECATKHPPHYVSLEMESKTHVKEILLWATKKYSTLGGLEQALGMSRQTLGESLRSLLGISAEELYPTTQRVRTRAKALVRRTGARPEWLQKFSLDDLVLAMERAHGKSTVVTSAPLLRVQRVIDSL